VARLALGALVFVGAAAGLEFAANVVRYEPLALRVQVVVEELGEMLGVSLMAWGMLDLAILEGARPGWRQAPQGALSSSTSPR